MIASMALDGSQLPMHRTRVCGPLTALTIVSYCAPKVAVGV